MKHHLSSFRRATWPRLILCVILAFMLCPVGVMAATSMAAPPLASMGFNPTLGFAGLAAGGAYMMLRSPADDGGEGGGGGGGASQEEKVDVPAAIAKIEDKTLPISQRLGVALQALKGVDPTQQLAGTQQKLTEANATIAQRDVEITRLNAELNTAKQQLSAREQDVTQLESANATLEAENKRLKSKEQDIDKRAGSKANERIASLGFPASKLPNPQSTEQTKNLPENEAKLEEALKACKTQKERSQLLHDYRAARA